EGGAGGVGVGEQPGAGGAAEQLVQRLAGLLGGDVPQGHVDRGDGGHGDRSATPVGAAVEVLPGRLDLRLVATDEGGGDVVAQVGDDRELSAVQRAVAEADDPVGGSDLDGHEVPAGAGDGDVDAFDAHRVLSWGASGWGSVWSMGWQPRSPPRSVLYYETCISERAISIRPRIVYGIDAARGPARRPTERMDPMTTTPEPAASP